MIDISKEAVERLVDDAMADGMEDYGLTMNALSARLQELSALVVIKDREARSARLQALDEALEAVRKEQRFHPMTQDFKAVIEALKGDTP